MNSTIAQAAGQQIDSVLNNVGISNNSVRSKYQYALHGFAAHLTSEQIKRLQQSPIVDHISQDYRFKGISNSGVKVIKTTSSAQTDPWGIYRVGGPFNGTGKKAWIIDTGVDLDHPDLNVDAANSVSFVSGESVDDQNGHGTHVAGIIAAKDNSIDVVGVAAGATVVALKACDKDGNCTIQSILNALDYVPQKASTADVINMSIGIYPADTDVDNAVINDANNGLRFTIAAANHTYGQSPDANDWSPSRVNNANVWTVSAFKQGDDFAVSFTCNTAYGSNHGNPPVDYSEPGDEIL